MINFPKIYAGRDLKGSNFSGQDLSSAIFGGANLADTDISMATLVEADLGQANLSGTNLTGSDLRRADFRGANLAGAILRNADLRGANFSGANLENIEIDASTLIDPNLRAIFVARSKLKSHVDVGHSRLMQSAVTLNPIDDDPDIQALIDSIPLNDIYDELQNLAERISIILETLSDTPIALN